MDRPIELILLVCLQCATPIPAEGEEVAWVCAQCGQGMFLDKENGLARVEVNYSAAVAPDALAKPFWVAEGKVSLSRHPHGSGSRENQEAAAFWAEPRRFFVPAYSASLEILLNQAAGLLLNPPSLNPGPQTRFEPVTLQLEDVKAAAEFIIVAVEASRKDKLKTLDFKLELSAPILWVLP